MQKAHTAYACIVCAVHFGAASASCEWFEIVLAVVGQPHHSSHAPIASNSFHNYASSQCSKCTAFLHRIFACLPCWTRTKLAQPLANIQKCRFWQMTNHKTLRSRVACISPWEPISEWKKNVESSVGHICKSGILWRLWQYWTCMLVWAAISNGWTMNKRHDFNLKKHKFQCGIWKLCGADTGDCHDWRRSTDKSVQRNKEKKRLSASSSPQRHSPFFCTKIRSLFSPQNYFNYKHSVNLGIDTRVHTKLASLLVCAVCVCCV